MGIKKYYAASRNKWKGRRLKRTIRASAVPYATARERQGFARCRTACGRKRFKP